MTQDKENGAPARKPRADGERNRQRLIEAAKSVFAAKGSSASLDEIARTAGVGIGTLYRHFPTRDALISGLYRNETTQMAEAATRLADTHAPAEALRQWLLLFVHYMATKHGMAEVLNSVTGGVGALYADSATCILGALQDLVDRATASGEIRLGLAPIDVLRAIAGVGTVSSEPGWEKSARQLVDIIMAGIRVR
ncbi:TetR/AcrR family transcriptional regulator [Burkholderia gladioli]|uniref:TetR/AcrR family transcriptional regulator n=1 Tax=Burkholderia gladioli TaxID=28095 RepID=UPI003B97E4FB